MSTARDSVARQSRDRNETSHETPVIPLRPGLTAAPEEPSPEPLTGAQRRAEALRLSRDEGLSLRDIGKRLGISKDAASRDIKAAKLEEAQAAQAAAETVRDSAETSQETTDGADETPAAPDDGDRDTLVLVLDEPLRQALAVLRSTRGGPDTPEQNQRAARAAIRAMADTVLDMRQHTQEGTTP